MSPRFSPTMVLPLPLSLRFPCEAAALTHGRAISSAKVASKTSIYRIAALAQDHSPGPLHRTPVTCTRRRCMAHETVTANVRNVRKVHKHDALLHMRSHGE